MSAITEFFSRKVAVCRKNNLNGFTLFFCELFGITKCRPFMHDVLASVAFPNLTHNRPLTPCLNVVLK